MDILRDDHPIHFQIRDIIYGNLESPCGQLFLDERELGLAIYNYI
jgi:hypothetical protein